MKVVSIKKLRDRYIREGYKLALKEMKQLNEDSIKQQAFKNDGWVPVDEFVFTPSKNEYKTLVNGCEDMNGTIVRVGSYIAKADKGEVSKRAKVLAIYEIDKKKCGWMKPDSTHEIVAVWKTTVDKRIYVKTISVENTDAIRVSATGKIKR